jgi:glutamine cyclotransferase
LGVDLPKMRKINLGPIVLAFGLFATTFIQGCNDKEKDQSEVKTSPRIRKQIEIAAPASGSTFKLGDGISFQLSHREGKSIDSIRFSLFGETTIQEGDTFDWEATITGKPSIKLSAFVEGVVETVYPNITILAAEPPVEFNYQVVNQYPHDESAYTQGLYFNGNDLIESTGQRGRSTIRITNYETGEVKKVRNLGSEYFGEGATIYDDKIYQLTWTSQRVFVYDLELEPLQTLTYPGEGWGLAHLDDMLIISDGSEKLRFVNPDDLSEQKTLEVYDTEGKVTSLNELEIIDNMLYANIYGEDIIIGIDLASGAVLRRINFSNLIDRRLYQGLDYALNGIAYKHDEGRIFVTGKLWPTLFEVKLIQKPI